MAKWDEWTSDYAGTWTCEQWLKKDKAWEVTTYDANDEVVDIRKEDEPILAIWDHAGGGMCVRYTDGEEVQKRRDAYKRRQSIHIVK